jgi:hypothetical protein
MTLLRRLASFLPAAICLLLLAGPVRAAGPKVDELARLLEDSNYKVRLQAALLLGKLGDKSAVTPLTRALEDKDRLVRAMAAQSLARLGAPDAAPALKALLQHERDAFVRGQVEKALAALGPTRGSGAKIYLTFGSFTGGAARITDPAMLNALRAGLKRELSKLNGVTFTLESGEEKSFARSGRVGFLIDGNVTRLDDGQVGGAVEINCDVKIMVARWPSKSIILWTNAGAAVQSGSHERDKASARRDCLEASAGQLGEDLAKFFHSQGG